MYFSHRLKKLFVGGTRWGILFALLLITTLSSANDDIRVNSVVRALEKVSPAVVNISSEYEVRQRSSPFSSFGIDPFFDSFFKDFLIPDSNAVIAGPAWDRVSSSTQPRIYPDQCPCNYQTGKISIFMKDESEFEAHIVAPIQIPIWQC